jgi:hypothetical protein
MTPRLRLLVIALAASIALLLLSSGLGTRTVSAGWLVEAVTNGGGYGVSLAIDSHDNVLIVFENASDETIRYATNGSGPWTVSTIDTHVRSYWSSVKVDANDKVHACYYNWNLNGVIYATNAGGSWVSSKVASIGVYDFVLTGISLALDSKGKVYISCYDMTNDDLLFVTNVDGPWSNFTVDSLWNAGRYSSIGVDSHGTIHISYIYEPWASATRLKYATNASGSWQITTIDQSAFNSLGYYNSLCLDSDDKVHISYCDLTKNDLKHATNLGGTWVNETVDSAADIGYRTSIAVDRGNNVHISYHDQALKNLKYATNIGGSWALATVDSPGNIGESSSIAVDSTNTVHIGYSSAPSSVKHATGGTTAIPELGSIEVPSILFVMCVLMYFLRERSVGKT